MDLVRRTLEEARGAARGRGQGCRPQAAGASTATAAGGRQRAVGAGPGPGPTPGIRNARVGRQPTSPDDPRLVADQVAEGAVFGQWPAVVGEQIAEHAAPTALNEGVLSVSAESTAWATQLRMVQAQLLAKIAAAVGDGVVTSLKITGPVGAVVAQGAAATSPAGGRATPTADGPAFYRLRAARTPRSGCASVRTLLGSQNSAHGRIR